MTSSSRRTFVLGAGAVVLGAACKKKDNRAADTDEEEISPAEDLMREHGVLNRILLAYEEVIRRVGAQEEPPPDVIARGADIVRRFIEGYHEKLEEDFLFPRFEKAEKHVALVSTLRAQHRAGRSLTDDILRLATPTTMKDAGARQQMAETMQRFVRMYRPHEAREDTVLFPALRTVIGKKELEELAERFEDREHELFGKAGFEGVVEQVADLERTLGIYDLNQFTPLVT